MLTKERRIFIDPIAYITIHLLFLNANNIEFRNPTFFPVDTTPPNAARKGTSNLERRTGARGEECLGGGARREAVVRRKWSWVGGSGKKTDARRIGNG